ncbi:MAG: 3-deoxy-D-manno-octulosonic acid transferase [Gammaproteobacteria bacterium]|nr:3-deoxy-D-manno-octulosonic acid transferase [Gammaproteobacteria bacterium]
MNISNKRISNRVSPIKTGVARLIYNVLLLVFLIVDFTKWLVSQWLVSLKLRDLNKVKRDWRWGQKFGFLSVNRPDTNSGQTLLIHCASVGEVVAAIPLLKQMVNENPSLNAVVTTNTLTGKQQLQRSINNTELESCVVHDYLPVDLPGLMRRFIKFINPSLVMIMEVELWPNFINQTAKQNIPLVVVNGRMTDKTCKGYQRFHWLSQPMLFSIDHIFARNTGDFDNYQRLGISSERLQLVGNIKFDIDLPNQDDAANLKDAMGLNNRIVLVAGSTHEDEEQALIDAFKQLQPQYSELLLFIIPRHPHRFDAVFELITQHKLTVTRTSQSSSVEHNIQVLLGDEMGKLGQWYGIADMVFVGGSLVRRGGHNPIEAAAFAKPIIMGPHIYNNPEIVQTLADDGGVVLVNEQQQLRQVLNNWLADPEQKNACGLNGLNTIKQNQGVVQTIVTKVSTHFIK